MKKFIPVGTKVMIEVDQSELQNKAGSIVLPDEVLEKYKTGHDTGIVKAIGRRCFSPPIGDGTADFAVGDRVLFKRYAGVESKSDLESRIRFMHDTDIVCKIVEE